MSVNVGGISFDITVDLSKLRTGLRDAKKEMKDFGKEIGKISKQVGSLSQDAGSIKTLADVLKQVTAANAKLATSATKANTAVDQFAKSTKSAVRDVDRLGDKTANAGKSITSFTLRVNHAGKSISNINQSVKELGQAGVAASAVFNRMGPAFDKIDQSVTKMADRQQAAAAAIQQATAKSGASVASTATAAAAATGAQTGLTQATVGTNAALGTQATQATAAGNSLNQLAGQAANTQNNYLALASALSAVGFGAFGMKVTSLIADTTLLAGRVESLGTVVKTIGGVSGYTGAELGNLEDRITRLGITTKAARETLALMAQSELDLTKSSQLARIAQDAAVIAGVNSSEATEQLIMGVQRTNTWMLRQLGILINLQELYARWADANGRVITTLTAQEKQQILLNEVIKKGALIAGTYEASMNDAYKRFTSLPRFIEQAKKAFGEQFIPILGKVTDALTSMLKAFTDAPGEVHILVASLTAAVAVFAMFTGAALAAAAAELAFAKATAIAGTTVGAMLAPIAAITAVIGALVGVYVAWTAAEKQWAENQKAAREEVRKQVDTMEDLREVVGDLRTYGQAANQSAQGQARFNAAVDRAIVLLPSLKHELRTAGQDFQKILDTIANKAPEALLTTEQAIRKAGNEVQTLAELRDRVSRLVSTAVTQQSDPKRIAERDRTQSELDKLGLNAKRFKLGPLGGQGASSEALANIETALAVATEKYLALRRAADTSAFDVLKKLADESDVGTNLATRMMERIADDRLRAWQDSNLEILAEYDRFQTELQGKGFQTMDQIEEFVPQFLQRQRQALLTRLADAKIADEADSTEQTQKALTEIRKLVKEDEATYESRRIEMVAAEAAGLATRLEAQRQASELVAEKTRQVTEDALADLERIQRIAGGEDPESVKADLEVRKRQKLQEEVNAQFDSEADKRAKLRLARQEAVTKAEEALSRDSTNKRLQEQLKIEKIRLANAEADEEQVQKQRESSQTVRAAREAETIAKAIEKKKAALEKASNRLLETTAQVLDKVGKLPAKAIDDGITLIDKQMNRLEDKLKDVKGELDGLQKKTEAVNNFIADEEASLADNALPGTQELYGTLGKFLDQIGKATSPDQIEKLLQLSSERVDVFFAKMEPDQYIEYGNELQRLAKDYFVQLEDAADTRKVELENQRSEFSLINEIKSIQAEMAQLEDRRLDVIKQINEQLVIQQQLLDNIFGRSQQLQQSKPETPTAPTTGGGASAPASGGSSGSGGSAGGSSSPGSSSGSSQGSGGGFNQQAGTSRLSGVDGLALQAAEAAAQQASAKAFSSEMKASIDAANKIEGDNRKAALDYQKKVEAETKRAGDFAEKQREAESQAVNASSKVADKTFSPSGLNAPGSFNLRLFSSKAFNAKAFKGPSVARPDLQDLENLLKTRGLRLPNFFRADRNNLPATPVPQGAPKMDSAVQQLLQSLSSLTDATNDAFASTASGIQKVAGVAEAGASSLKTQQRDYASSLGGVGL